MSRKKKRRFGRLLLVPALVAVVAVVAMVSAMMLLRAATTITGGPADVADNDTSTAAVPQERTIDVAATASAFPFVQRWVTQYNNDEQSAGRASVSYFEEGRVSLADGDLAIVGLAPDTAGNGILYIPVAPQALAIVYNIPGFPDVPSGLKLNSTLLSQVLNGNITRWSDQSIGDLNPGLSLPDERIVVIHDGSGSLALANYLSNGTAAIQWPDGSVRVLGPAELAAAVRKTPYSIGYVDFSYAVQTRMTFAAVENEGGRYAVPSTNSIDEALKNALTYHNATDSNQTGSIKPPMINSNRLVNGSYPLVGLYYAAVSTGNNGTALDFVRWMIDEGGGQQALSEVQYPAIYRDGDGLLAKYAENVPPPA